MFFVFSEYLQVNEILIDEQKETWTKDINVLVRKNNN